MDKTLKILIGTFLVLCIAEIVHTLGAMLTMNYYLMPEYSSVWSKIMMPANAAPGLEFYVLSILFNLIGALIFVLVYNYIKDGIKAGNRWKKGMTYGFLVFCVAGLTGALSMILILNLPYVLIIGWSIEGLLIYLFGGAITGKVIG